MENQRFTVPSSYEGPQIINPLMQEWGHFLSLPLYSLVSVDGVVFEKIATLSGHDATFAELGHLDQSDGISGGVFSAEELMSSFIDSKITLLRVGA